jgi:hypothetical protein
MRDSAIKIKWTLGCILESDRSTFATNDRLKDTGKENQSAIRDASTNPVPSTGGSSASEFGWRRGSR